jgi:hypothetical protein
MIQLNVSGSYVSLVVNGSIQEELNKDTDQVGYNKYSDGKVSLIFGRRSFEQVSPTDFEIDGEAVTDAADFVTKLEAVFTRYGAAPGGSSPYLVASVTLTDAQIKALPTTPFEIVAYPGANKYIRFIGGDIMPDVVVSYGNINITGSILIMAYEGLDYISNGLVENEIENLLNSNIYSQFSPAVSGTGGAAQITKASVINKSLVLHYDNAGSGNLNLGNAANTLKVTVYYVVVDL